MSISKTEEQYNECIFCDQEGGDSLFFMMNDAIKVKYSDNPRELRQNYVDVILRLQQAENKQQAQFACRYRERRVDDEEDQFLKRQYNIMQYGEKITSLTEYYKFHSDVPRVVQQNIQRIMSRYYDKKREYDYKRIKRVLKQEKGLSITSIQDQSSQMQDSQIPKKSRYSTLLNAVSQIESPQLSDSHVLTQFCKMIDKAIPKEQDYNFKGSFPEQKRFEYYVRLQENKQRQRGKEKRDLQQKKVLKKFNYQQFLKSRERATEDSKEIIKPPRQQKKNEKQGKFTYNTNIKIEIRNAMFFSEGQPTLHLGTLEQDLQNRLDGKFKKKNSFGKGTSKANLLRHYRENQKIAAQIYKSSQLDLRLKNSTLNQRANPKDSINQSRSREKGRSNSKKMLQTRRTVKSNSTTRLNVNPKQWILSRQPSRSISTNVLKKRSISTHTGISSTANNTPSASKRFQRGGSIQKRPIQILSRYGSSQFKTAEARQKNLESKTISIKEILNRKLNFKIN